MVSTYLVVGGLACLWSGGPGPPLDQEGLINFFSSKVSSLSFPTLLLQRKLLNVAFLPRERNICIYGLEFFCKEDLYFPPHLLIHSKYFLMRKIFLM
jgi:hypothetical protein